MGILAHCEDGASGDTARTCSGALARGEGGGEEIPHFRFFVVAGVRAGARAKMLEKMKMISFDSPFDERERARGALHRNETPGSSGLAFPIPELTLLVYISMSETRTKNTLSDSPLMLSKMSFTAM